MSRFANGNPGARCPPMTAPFRSYKRTDEEVFEDGRESGFTWLARWDHLPGGPYFPRLTQADLESRHPDWVAYCRLQERHHLIWLDGWHEGFKQAAAVRPEIRRLRNKLLVRKLAA